MLTPDIPASQYWLHSVDLERTITLEALLIAKEGTLYAESKLDCMST